MALNVIMMGPPGAGKGTQAERFARERGLLKVSTGDILREAVQSQTPLGLKAKAIIDAGKLVDDATMIEIVRERLLQPDAMRGFVLDGFPRTVAQAELVKRLSTRRICASCGFNADPFDGGAGNRCKRCGGEFVQRTDDNEAVVLKRLGIYDRDTRPLVEYYKTRPTFRVVYGAQSPEQVAKDLDQAIDAAAAQEAQR